MTFGSVCSGIEAASVAWLPLGFKCAFTAEVEKFPCAVLNHHYPDVPNHGDITKFKDWPDHAIDILVGGTPCQSFSVAGLRKGMDDPRGNLALVFLGIVDRYRPTWVCWENVPGVHSSWSDEATSAPSQEARRILAADGLDPADFVEVEQSSDFDCFLGGLEQLGYGVATRIFDAQFFNLAQRRERVFVVGHSGGLWQRAAAVLFERESLRGDPPPSRSAGKGTSTSTAPSLTGSGRGVGRTGESLGQDPVIAIQERAGADLNCGPGGKGYRDDGTSYTLEARHHVQSVVHSLRADGFDASEDGTGRGTPLIAMPITAGMSASASRMPHEQGALIPEVAYALQERDSKGSDSSTKVGHLIPVSSPIAFDTTQITSPSNYSEPKEGQPCHPLASGAHPPAIAFSSKDNGADAGELSPTLRAAGHDGSHANSGAPPAIAAAMAVRRLTPRECERLQGFPDDCTDIRLNGKPTPDGPRCKALGNSMAVPVMAWIGRRIALVDTI